MPKTDIKPLRRLKIGNKGLSEDQATRLKTDLCLAAPDFLMIDPYNWPRPKVAEFLGWWLARTDNHQIEATERKEAAAELVMLGLDQLPGLTKTAAAFFVDQWLNALDEI